MRIELGSEVYRLGALERLDDAITLIESERPAFANAVYLAGRAVEGMLRGLLLRKDPDLRRGRKSLDTGHDLRELLKSVQRLGLVSASSPDQEFAASVQSVARLWNNQLRFVDNATLSRCWRRVLGKRAKMDVAAREFLNACGQIVRRCEVLWQR